MVGGGFQHEGGTARAASRRPAPSGARERTGSRDLGGVLEAYQEVARRLGVLTENPRPKGLGPVLVSSNGQKPN